MKHTIIALALIGMSSIPSIAQDAHSGHGAPAASGGSLAAELPEICLTAAAVTADPMAMDHEMDAAHTDLMAGMDENNQLMMQAGMVEDLDVAFVCAMIPHHQSAINMAKAELEHGDNKWAKDMAQKIIGAQEAEIAEMVTWLEGDGAGE
jgi:hypothetical protein